MSRIRVQIDRLALMGLHPGQEKGLVDALRAELSQILSDPADHRAWALSRRIPVVRIADVPLHSGPAGGNRNGVAIARGIAHGLRQ